ncbi:unnamed protein product [Ixodes persulcatus]
MAANITRLETALDALQKSNQDIVQLGGTVQKLEELVHIQQTKITNLEDRARRNNLIVFGIPETRSETDDELKTKVISDVFEQQLGVTGKTVVRIHRLGKKKEGKCRPVIMKLYDHNEKVQVFQNCKKLKGSKISVSNDYSQATLYKRRILWESASEERSRRLRVRLVNDEMQIGDETFIWNDAVGCREKVTDSRGSQSGNK